jgi:ribosomal protein S18 acetylase RimI-like enzyme
MRLADLRQVRVQTLDPLFEEEARLWAQDLHWDYRPSLALIHRYVDTHSLTGFALLEDRRALGYCFYVVDDHKGIIGDLFVSPGATEESAARRLFEEAIRELSAHPGVERIEAQLIPFGAASFDSFLAALGFHLYPRQFMLMALGVSRSTELPNSNALSLEPWNDRYLDSCAELMHLAYAGHVDARINDHYQSHTGAAKFLRNIVLLPGCGQFLPEASFLLRQRNDTSLVGAVLASRVADHVGHITQICIRPGFQGHGLGRRLMEASIGSLVGLGYHSLSLTVTSRNSVAIQLYERLGFHTLKTFPAAVLEFSSPDC